MDNKNSDKLSFEEKIVADEVADEILTVDTSKEDKRYFILLLLFLLALIFLVSSISFAVFDTYFNGSSENAIKVGIDIGVDEDDDQDKDKDKDSSKDRDSSSNDGDSIIQGSDNLSGGDGDDSSSDINDGDNSSDKPDIDSGSVLFTFNEGSNYISMSNVFPTEDEVGRNLTGDKQYFDFNVAAEFDDTSKGSLVYEISLVPVSGNTISLNDVRVYLTENKKGVSVLDNDVNTISSLPNSTYRKGGKVLYRKTVNDSYRASYEFRMWLSKDANINEVARIFGCKIVVDAYYK